MTLRIKQDHSRFRQIVRGKISVPTTPGLGIEADPEKMARYAVDC